jgi:hypothetical protein
VPRDRFGVNLATLAEVCENAGRAKEIYGAESSSLILGGVIYLLASSVAF